MTPAYGRRALALVTAVAMAAIGGCSTKAEDDGSEQGRGGVKTGRGVSGDTIKIGALTDLTGAFAALGKDITIAQKLYWDGRNNGAKVCGKYRVETVVKDHGYVTQTGISLYSSLHNDVLALGQTIGSPINTGLSEQLAKDKMVNVPAAWAQSLTTNPENAIVGATYEIEMINVLDYLLKQGTIKEGDKIGHIYFEGEYGAGGLAGSKYFAARHKMTVVEAKIQPTDQDMTAQVTRFRAAGVKVLALTTSPTATASAAVVAAAEGMDVPIVGNNPVFAPALLKGPAGSALKKHLYVASPVSSFDRNGALLKTYTAKYPGSAPRLGVVFGTAAADGMRQVLEKACRAGDLSPAGLP
jgi:ABC-type branched-subunit amino acid transport system substrate-binding protein